MSRTGFAPPDSGHALCAFADIVSARCDDVAPVTTAPEKNMRKPPCRAHFDAQIERTSAVSCAQGKYSSLRRWGRPTRATDSPVPAEVVFTSELAQR